MTFRFSGHETFPCRYAWLPKAYGALTKSRNAFGNEEDAMIALGVGKNMVRAIRFWVQATGIAELDPAGGHRITPFGKALFGHRGHDPFLEDIRTLWLIHWQLAAQTAEPLFAWDFLLNRWQNPDFGRTEVLRAFHKEAERLERRLSSVTLEQHFDTFLHTYVPTRSRKGDIQEDNLDCPLVELELIVAVGERRIDGSGRREAVYAFRREEKPEITSELFAYCIDDFWCKRRGSEKTLSFRDIAAAHGSPGQVLKLPEWDIRQRLESLAEDTGGALSYRESTSQQQLTRGEGVERDFLAAIY
jgi:Protein of unknown function (DUF4007)